MIVMKVPLELLQLKAPFSDIHVGIVHDSGFCAFGSPAAGFVYCHFHFNVIDAEHAEFRRSAHLLRCIYKSVPIIKETQLFRPIAPQRFPHATSKDDIY